MYLSTYNFLRLVRCWEELSAFFGCALTIFIHENKSSLLVVANNHNLGHIQRNPSLPFYGMQDNVRKMGHLPTLV